MSQNGDLRVSVIDYDMGNLRSIANALRHVGAEVRVVREASEVRAADRVVLPGVGAFGAAMRRLSSSGVDDAVRDHVAAGRPFLGICIGFQVLFALGDEHGERPGLGLVDGEIRRFCTDLHVPHVGWNALNLRAHHPVFDGHSPEPHVYFVHSYRAVGVRDADVIATTEYGEPFVSAVARDALVATQFHPEKSGPEGLRILKNFLTWRP